ncbi:MAG: hypothetical protein AB1502_06480 [Thermodesulfobacteriota bacterium]
MAEKGLTKRDLEQLFKGFEKRQDEKFKTLEKRVVEQFHIISEGLIDQIKLLAEGHAGIIDRLGIIERESERQHLETRSLIKISFVELDKRLTDLETQMKEMQKWKKQVEERLQI